MNTKSTYHAWPICHAVTTTLVRVASSCTLPTTKASTATNTKTASAKRRSCCHHTAAAESEWAMVPVLNELLDHTSWRQNRAIWNHDEPQPTTSQPHLHRHRDQRRRPPTCLNCQRKYSLPHDAASQPQQGFCSLDCRTSCQYRTSIEPDFDTAKWWPDSLNSTLESTYSPAATPTESSPIGQEEEELCVHARVA